MQPLNAICLASIVLLSLVLPVYTSLLLSRRGERLQRPTLFCLLIGQGFIAVAGVLQIARVSPPILCLTQAMVVCLAFLWVMKRQRIAR